MPANGGRTVGDAVADGTVRPSVNADTVMDVVAGAAWYAVVVRKVTDLDAAATQLADLVLRGVLAGPRPATS